MAHCGAVRFRSLRPWMSRSIGRGQGTSSSPPPGVAVAAVVVVELDTPLVGVRKSRQLSSIRMNSASSASTSRMGLVVVAVAVVAASTRLMSSQAWSAVVVCLAWVGLLLRSDQLAYLFGSWADPCLVGGKRHGGSASLACVLGSSPLVHVHVQPWVRPTLVAARVRLRFKSSF